MVMTLCVQLDSLRGIWAALDSISIAIAKALADIRDYSICIYEFLKLIRSMGGVLFREWYLDCLPLQGRQQLR